MEGLFQFLDQGIFLILLAVGYFAGRAAEMRHFASIRKREGRVGRKVMTFSTRFPPALQADQDVQLVSGCVVIGSDYFKQFASGLRTLFGGRMRAYETLLDRARREAILRMKEDAQRRGYELVFNVKIESTNITGASRGALPAVEAFAYGTALRPSKQAAAH
jgi:uncharacterized protein YbjQ (UPF0145 family)